VLTVFGLRMAGFACSVMTVKTPSAAAVQYLMMVAAIAAGMFIIVRGIVVDAPAALLEAINKNAERMTRLFGRPATA
jgi:lipopolysaccharide export system permease protein